MKGIKSFSWLPPSPPHTCWTIKCLWFHLVTQLLHSAPTSRFSKILNCLIIMSWAVSTAASRTRSTCRALIQYVDWDGLVYSVPYGAWRATPSVRVCVCVCRVTLSSGTLRSQTKYPTFIISTLISAPSHSVALDGCPSEDSTSLPVKSPGHYVCLSLSVTALTTHRPNSRTTRLWQSIMRRRIG